MEYMGKRDLLIYKRRTSLKSQAEVACKLGISQPYYSQIENGYREPKDSEIKILCELFKLPKSYFKASKKKGA